MVGVMRRIGAVTSVSWVIARRAPPPGGGCERCAVRGGPSPSSSSSCSELYSSSSSSSSFQSSSSHSSPSSPPGSSSSGGGVPLSRRSGGTDLERCDVEATCGKLSYGPRRPVPGPTVADKKPDCSYWVLRGLALAATLFLTAGALSPYLGNGGAAERLDGCSVFLAPSVSPEVFPCLCAFSLCCVR